MIYVGVSCAQSAQKCGHVKQKWEKREKIGFERQKVIVSLSFSGSSGGNPV
jgi:hypothetical protein